MQVDYDAEIQFIADNTDRNSQQITTLLENLSNVLRDEFESRKSALITYIKTVDRDANFMRNVNDAAIVYTDYFRKLVRKIENLVTPRNIHFERNDRIVELHSKLIDDESKKQFSSLFAAICRYGSKTDQEMNYYSNPRFCSYIITKTYKKTYGEVTDFLPLAVPDPLGLVNSNPVKIASIGGGPGNDGLAIADFLRDKLPNNIKIFVDVYDLNHEAWQSTNGKVISELYKDSGITVEWKFANHQESDSIDIKGYDFVIACWTLNESINFCSDFWTGVVNNNVHAKFIIIEGERKNVDKLYQIMIDSGMEDVYYERNSNPRRLYGQKKATNSIS